MMQIIHHQKGVAAIVFVIIFPFFFGFFALAIEGTRYLTDSAHLSDIAESASLAVAASVEHRGDRQRIRDYLAATIPDANISDENITITSQSCEEIYGQRCGQAGVYDKEGLRFNEYKVAIRSSFISWFPDSDIIHGFEENQRLSNTAVARKYQQDYVDVVFVADFSGSMLDRWEGFERKYQGVISRIQNIVNTLDDYNQIISETNQKNKFGFVGYNSYVHLRKRDWGDDHAFNYLNISVCDILDDSQWNLEYGYFNGRKKRWGPFPYDGRAVSDFSNRYFNHCYFATGSSNGMSYEYRYHDDNGNIYIYNHDDVVFNQEGINRFIEGQSGILENIFNSSHGIDVGNGQDGNGTFHNIDLTTNNRNFNNTIGRFRPLSGTSSYQGIISAARMLDQETTNRKKLIIVLSDGRDWYPKISEQIYSAGLCSNIRQHFKNKGETLTMAFIGFDYELHTFPAISY